MSEESSSETPLLDEWRAEVGDEAVAAAIEAARAQIADGSLRGFSDKDELLEYLQGTHRQLFEDQLPSGISVTYFINEQVPYVGVVRVRRR